MMRRGIFILFSIVLALNANAEDPLIPFDEEEDAFFQKQPEPAATRITEKAPSPIDSALELSSAKGDPLIRQKLQVEMSERAYRNRPETRTKDAYIQALENLASELCFPGIFTTLTYSGPPREPACIEILTLISNLYQSNPIVVCANEGIDSLACRDLYKQQKTAPLVAEKSFATLSPAEQLTKKLEYTKQQNVLNALTPELNAISSRYRAKKDEELGLKIKDLTKKILEAVCKDISLRLELLPEVQAKTDNTSLENEIEALSGVGAEKVDPQNTPRIQPRITAPDIFEQKANEKQPTPGPDNALSKTGPFRRTRLIPPLCQSYIDYGISMDPEFSASICYRDGLYSPSCIDALRNARIKNKQLGIVPSQPSQPKRGKDGLSSF